MWVDASPSWAGVGCGLPRFCRSGPGDSRCINHQGFGTSTKLIRLARRASHRLLREFPGRFDFD